MYVGGWASLRHPHTTYVYGVLHMLNVTYPQKVSWPPQSWAIANVLTVSGTFIISRSILFIIINTVTKVFLKQIPSLFLLSHTHTCLHTSWSLISQLLFTTTTRRGVFTRTVSKTHASRGMKWQTVGVYPPPLPYLPLSMLYTQFKRLPDTPPQPC